MGTTAAGVARVPPARVSLTRGIYANNATPRRCLDQTCSGLDGVGSTPTMSAPLCPMHVTLREGNTCDYCETCERRFETTRLSDML